ncbi:Mov34/MPN/PAD-1 family protein [Haloarcula pellucida]|uniref:JAB domain-containing protein n=1 Tax=Haloarcula pellucida TaxID=1427151 RepID=A0A830GR37_9EURY|nr:Mov34/MPN/PAD-1 family protein [Halomicroarcula pellucida]MBX0350153.1 Mov34/MPN/PAD-1 family protein [Halomicroarcula pellucida]GGO00653.1 hypothetical protein GCM10009030_33520 [Halomicroarcula pellucida]
MYAVRRPSALVVPQAVRAAIADDVRTAHPHEAGGFLGCERRDGRLYATSHVALDNEAETPRRRFVSTATDAVPPSPRVFYHSHTSASTPSGLTGVDRRNIPDSLALVVFAPHGDPYSYRLFRRALFNWQEVPVETAEESAAVGRERLPRLV